MTIAEMTEEKMNEALEKYMDVGCCEFGNKFILWDEDETEYFIHTEDKEGRQFKQPVSYCPFCGREVHDPELVPLRQNKNKWVVNPSEWLLRQLYLLDDRYVTIEDDRFHIRIQHLEPYIRSNIAKLNPLTVYCDEKEVEDRADDDKEFVYVFTSERSLRIKGRGLVKTVRLTGWTMKAMHELHGRTAIIDGTKYKIVNIEYAGSKTDRVPNPVGLVVKEI